MKKSYNKIIILVLTIFYGIILLLFSFNTLKYKNYIIQEGGEANLGPILNKRVEQTFYCDKENLSSISVLVGTYGRFNRCNVTFILIGPNNDIVYKKTSSAALLPDDTFCTFKFPHIENSKGHEYRFIINITNANLKNYITLWNSSQDNYKKGQLFFDGVKQNGDLCFKNGYYQKDAFSNLNDALKNIKTNKLLVISTIFILFILILVFNYLLQSVFFLSDREKQ